MLESSKKRKGWQPGKLANKHFEVAALTKQGLSAEAIGKLFGVAKPTVLRYRKRIGVVAGSRQLLCPKKEKSPNWKGDNVVVETLRRRRRQKKGPARYCEECNITNTNTRYIWCNLTGNYADFNDYKSMCCKCNYAYLHKKEAKQHQSVYVGVKFNRKPTLDDFSCDEYLEWLKNKKEATQTENY